MIEAQRDYSNGFVKLPDNYEDTLAIANSFDGVETSSFKLQKVLAHAMSSLSDQFYLADINLSEVASGNAAVWKSSDFIQSSLNWSKSKVARIKGELRDLGLITVHYDHRNRPLEGQAVTLAPFFARLSESEKMVAQAFSNRRLKYKAQQAERSDTTLGTEGIKSESLIQTPQNICLNTVPEGATGYSSSAKACGRKSDGKHQTVSRQNTSSAFNQKSHWSSAKNQPDFVVRTECHKEIPLLSEVQKSKIRLTISKSPTLFKLLSKNTELGDAWKEDQLFQTLKSAVNTVWPENNTAEHTFLWAFRRYAWRSVELLVVALEDPEIRDGQRWFGAMATRQKEAFSLKPNFDRISKTKTSRIEPQKSSVMDASLSGLEKYLDNTILERWFAKCQLIVEENTPRIVFPNGFHKDYCEKHYGKQLVAFGASRFKLADGYRKLLFTCDKSH